MFALFLNMEYFFDPSFFKMQFFKNQPFLKIKIF